MKSFFYKVRPLIEGYLQKFSKEVYNLLIIQNNFKFYTNIVNVIVS